MDWNKIIKLFKDYESLHLGGQALIISSKLLNTPIHEEIIFITKDKDAKGLAHKYYVLPGGNGEFTFRTTPRICDKISRSLFVFT